MLNPAQAVRPKDALESEPVGDRSGFRLYFDPALRDPTPYGDSGSYFRKSKDRMDITFDLIRSEVKGKRIVDIGASPFYLLYRAGGAGAEECHGVYFSNDDHPLKNSDTIYSEHGAISLSHANIENDPLSYPDNSVDIITACEIIEHCEYFPENLAKETRRILKSGGLLCITVPNVASIANIVKLVFRKNIYMRYRSDPTGRHKHEYTLAQLKSFIAYLDMDVVKSGYIPSTTSDKRWLRPIYKAIATLPFIRGYSPKMYILARQRDPKPAGPLPPPPKDLYDDALSIED